MTLMSLLRKAEKAENNRDFERAVECYEKILDRYPDNQKARRAMQRISSSTNSSGRSSKSSTQSLEKARSFMANGDFGLAQKILSGLTFSSDQFASQVLSLRAICYANSNEAKKAECCFQDALRCCPDDVRLNLNYLKFSWSVKAYANVLACLERIPVDSLDAAIIALGVEAFIQLNRASEGLELLGRLKNSGFSKSDEIKILRSRLFRATGDLDAAKAVLNGVLPGDYRYHSEMAHCFRAEGLISTAHEHCDQALEIETNNHDLVYQKAILLLDDMSLSEAQFLLDEIINQNPRHVDAKYRRALIQLHLGEFAKGFSDYDLRWKVKPFTLSPSHFEIPQWVGQQHVRLLVWGEQGLGDVICFSRYLRVLHEEELHVTVSIDSRLIPILRRSFSDKYEFISQDSEIIGLSACYDFHLPIASLASYYYFKKGLTLSDLNRPYLSPIRSSTDQFVEEIKLESDSRCEEKSCFRIGISWIGGGMRTDPMRHRFVPLHHLMAALTADGVEIIDLQYGSGFEKHPSLSTSRVDNTNDLDGVSRIVASCDLIVAVDNTLLHLASALGTPALGLIPFCNDWRWSTLTGDKLYANTTILQQNVRSDWSSVLGILKTMVRNIVESHKVS